MVEGEARLVRLARLMAVMSLALAIVVAYGYGTNYLKYLQWTGGARGDIATALAYDTPSGGELSLTLEFRAPTVGFPAKIESVEFSLTGPEGHFGYYRVIIPAGVSPSTKGSDFTQLVLSSQIPPEYWPGLRTSSEPQLDGRMIVRLYLPGREVPARIPISAPVSLGGDLM